MPRRLSFVHLLARIVRTGYRCHDFLLAALQGFYHHGSRCWVGAVSRYRLLAATGGQHLVAPAFGVVPQKVAGIAAVAAPIGAHPLPQARDGGRCQSAALKLVDVIAALQAFLQFDAGCSAG